MIEHEHHPVNDLPPEQRDAVQWQALQRASEIADNHAKKGTHWDMARRFTERNNQEDQIMSSAANIQAALEAYRSSPYDAKRYASGHGRYGGETKPVR